MARRRPVAVAVVGIIAATAALLPAAASAQDFSAAGPVWYIDAMQIQPIHDAGITGDGVTIAVVDSGIKADVATLSDANIEVRVIPGCENAEQKPDEFDEASHGTSVTSLIVGNGRSESGEGPIGIAPDARIIFYDIGDGEEACRTDAYAFALTDAVTQGADIVTYSGGSGRLTDEMSQPTVDSVRSALAADVIVVSAAPNADSVWEAILETTNGVVNVGAVDAQAQPAKRLDGSVLASEDVDVVAPGIDVAGLGWDGTWGLSAWSGSSAATPMVAGLLAMVKQKWPDATAAQVLQSLIRNTGSNPHELGWSNTVGYGVVNATRLLDEDPAQYPDENPLFKDDQLPSFDEVYAADPEPSAEPSSTPTTDTPADAASGVLPWAIGGGVVVLVGVVLIVILVNRRKSGGQADV